jgi:hypothetical protein
LITLPAVAVAGSLITAVLAWHGNDDVVAPDYYRRGLAINQELERRQRAAELGLQVEATAAGGFAGDQLRLHIVARAVLPPDAVLRGYLSVENETTANPMMLARINVSADGRDATYGGTLPTDLRGKDGRTRLRIESSTWRADTTVDVSSILVAH